MSKFLGKFAIVTAIAVLSCGFSPAEFLSGAYRGEPLGAALATFGPPIKVARVEGQRVYFWYVIYPSGMACKIWGAARHGIIENWGYQSCT